MRQSDCRESFKADAKTNFFPRTCIRTSRKKQNKREPGLVKEKIGRTEMLSWCSMINAAMTTSQINSISLVNVSTNDF